MAQVNPFAETQRGNGAPPPDDDGHGLLVPMIHSINQQLRDVRDLASQAATEAQLSRIEGRELRGRFAAFATGSSSSLAPSCSRSSFSASSTSFFDDHHPTR